MMVKKGGSVWKTASGTYRASVTVDGKRKTSKEFGKKREAEAWKIAQLAEIDRGRTYDAERTTFDTFANDWLKLKSGSLSANTVESYTRTLDMHIIPVLGRYRLGDVNAPARLQAFVTRLSKSTGARTVELSLTIIHGILAHAVRLRLIGYNAADLVTAPKPRRQTVTVWDETQVSQFLVAVQGHKNEHLFAVSIATGARVSEVIGLQWRDLDWSGRLRIHQQVYVPRGGGWKFQPTKSDRGRRQVELDAGLLNRLRDQWERDNALRLAAGEKWQEHDMIFPTVVGTPRNADNISHEFQKLVTLAGVPKIRLHDLRHTNASILLMHGVQPLVVAQRLGDDLATVLATYTHYIPGVESGAAGIAGSMVSPVEVEVKRESE